MRRMIDFDDKRWEGLKGGYKKPYDPRPALRELEKSDDPDTWQQLWEGLHHQGDVGETSYAAVPHLVRIQAHRSGVNWNVYALISTIEVERHRRGNPPIPSWLADSYRVAWETVLEIGTRDLGKTDDPLAVQAILGALALAKGELKLGAFIAESDSSEVDELLEQRSAWSKLYSEPKD
jgi:hypothetical protein